MRRPTTPRGILIVVLAAFTAVVGVVTLLVGYSATPLVEVVQILGVVGLGAAVVGGAIVFGLIGLADWKAPEDDFERIVQRSERLASDESWGPSDQDETEFDYWAEDEESDLDYSDEEDFRALVHAAVDDLPLEFHRALEHVAIVVADGGRGAHRLGRRGVYGTYQGDATASDFFHDRILIFKDRLLRDFGQDRELLHAQILETVRNELSRHFSSPGNGVGRS